MSEKKKIKIQTGSDAPAEGPMEPEAAADVQKDSPTAAPETAASEARENALQELEERLSAKEQEAKETYDRLLRVSAEFENYKKRTAREMEDLRKFANQSLIKEMLSVVDNLELALNSTDGKKTIDRRLLEGLEMTHKEILRVFEKFHVKPIEARGKPFDPTFHEAVMQEETDEYPENTVINELQRGYLIHDRLLRPAMVVVAKAKTGSEAGSKQSGRSQTKPKRKN